MTASFTRAATVTASTKRSGGVVDGLDSGYVENIASLSCLPLDPISPNLVLGIKGLAWYETLQTQTEGGLDIVEGDQLVVGTTEYPIRAVEEWIYRGNEFKRLYLEDTK